MSTAQTSDKPGPRSASMFRRSAQAAVVLALTVVGLVLVGAGAQAQTPLNWQFQSLDGPGVDGGNGRSSDQVAPEGTSTLIFSGTPHAFYDAEGLLRHAWWTGAAWNFETLDGDGGPDGQTTDPVGAGSVSFLYAGEPHVFYFGNPNGAMRHAWYSTTNFRWNYELLDGPGATGVGAVANAMAGTGSRTIFDNAPHVYYQDTVTSRLRHAWYSTVDLAWRFEDLDGPGVAGGDGRTTDAIDADMASVSFGGVGEPHVFYRAGATETSRLRHAWYSTVNFRWNFEDLDGPGVTGGNGRAEISTGFAPSSIIWAGTPHVFMRDNANQLRQAWYNPIAAQWAFNTLVTPADCGVGCEPGNEPSALDYGTPHVFHRDAGNGRLLHSWWTGATWALETLDGPGVAGGAGRTAGETGASPSSIVYGGFPHVFNVDTSQNTLRQAWYGPAPPAIVTAPSITGIAVVGEVLTANIGEWTNNPTTVLLQWLRCDPILTTSCSAIAGQTGSTYTVAEADLGFRIGLSVTASNSVGTTVGIAPVTPIVAEPGPQVTTISPPSGPTTGGTTVTITGLFLTGASSVTFDGVAGTSLSVTSDTQLTVVTPAGTAGSKDVVVTTPEGSTTVTNGFTYTVAKPALVTAPVVTGTAEVGQTLTLSNGVWTNSPTTYTYAWLRCSFFLGIFEICNGVGSTGTASTYVVDRADIGYFLKGVVQATNAGGSTQASSAPTATVTRPAPIISSLTPSTGPSSGGTSVTITGDFLTGSSGVTFDGVPGTSFTIINEFNATVVSPAGTAGPADVVVLSTAGNSDPFTFTYTAAAPTNVIAPAVTGTPTVGNTLNASTGTWTNAPTSYAYQWQRCTASCTDIPSETASTYLLTISDFGFTMRVVVTATNVQGSGNAPSSETAPVAASGPGLSTVTPSSGPPAGGTTVVITGTSFTGATDVTFGGVSATSFTVDSDTQITATTPAGSLGLVDVVVSTLAGTGLLPDGFEYISAPANDTVPVVSGTVEVGSTLSASNGTWTPTPDSYSYQWFRCNGGCVIIASATTPTYVVAVEDVGFSLKIAVTATNGVGSDTAESAETTLVPTPAPVIDFVVPGQGPTAGGTTVTISGQYFTGVTDVTFDGVSAASVVVDADTQLTVVTPAGSAGVIDVIAISPSGSSAPGAFEYTDAPLNTLEPSLDNTTPDVGNTVTVDPGTWTGTPSFTYQWYRCNPFPPTGPGDCTAIPSATNDNYTVTIDDAGYGLLVIVTGTNGFGSNEAAAGTNSVVPV